MKHIAAFLILLWQAGPSASNVKVAVNPEPRDRSSMADFVRILQVYDQNQ